MRERLQILYTSLWVGDLEQLAVTREKRQPGASLRRLVKQVVISNRLHEALAPVLSRFSNVLARELHASLESLCKRSGMNDSSHFFCRSFEGLCKALAQVHWRLEGKGCSKPVSFLVSRQKYRSNLETLNSCKMPRYQSLAFLVSVGCIDAGLALVASHTFQHMSTNPCPPPSCRCLPNVNALVHTPMSGASFIEAMAAC